MFCWHKWTRVIAAAQAAEKWIPKSATHMAPIAAEQVAQWLNSTALFVIPAGFIPSLHSPTGSATRWESHEPLP